MSDLKDCYRYHRQHGQTAEIALWHAREDIANNKSRYPRDNASNGIGAANQSGRSRLHWVERPEEIGLRKVDFADKLARIDHTGWYTEDDGMNGESMRGIVYQFPARGGKPRYVSGYADPCNADQYGNGPARLALFDITDDKQDAARSADSIAEREAEIERDYNRAWQAGRRYEDLGQEVAELRASCLALIRETKGACGALREYQSIKDTIRAQIGRYISQISEAREERRKLFDDFGDAPQFKDA